MKVEYEGKKVSIEELPEGRYLVRDEAHVMSDCILVDSAELEEKIQKRNYPNPVVRGPFHDLSIYLNKQDRPN